MRTTTSGMCLTVGELLSALADLHHTTCVEIADFGAVGAVESDSLCVSLEPFYGTEALQNLQDRLDELEGFLTDITEGEYKTKKDIVKRAIELEASR